MATHGRTWKTRALVFLALTIFILAAMWLRSSMNWDQIEGYHEDRGGSFPRSTVGLYSGGGLISLRYYRFDPFAAPIESFRITNESFGTPITLQNFFTQGSGIRFDHKTKQFSITISYPILILCLSLGLLGVAFKSFRGVRKPMRTRSRTRRGYQA